MFCVLSFVDMVCSLWAAFFFKKDKHYGKGRNKIIGQQLHIINHHRTKIQFEVLRYLHFLLRYTLRSLTSSLNKKTPHLRKVITTASKL